MKRSLQQRRVARQAAALRINVVHVPEPGVVQDRLRGAGWPLTANVDLCRLKTVSGMKRQLWEDIGRFTMDMVPPVNVDDCSVVLYTGTCDFV